MNPMVRLGGVTLGAAFVALLLAQPAQAACSAISNTADGFTKEAAVVRAQAGLKEAIASWSRENNKRVRVSAHPAEPRPFWREVVTTDLILAPDVKTADSHTICWRGVISPAVCTSSARICY